LFIVIRISLLQIVIENSQWPGVAGGAVALAGDVMAAATVSAATLLGAVLTVAVGRALLIAVDAGPAPRAHTLAVERVASGPVLALAVHLASSAPFTQRAPCS